MSKVLVTEAYLEDIADAIREKLGSQDTYTPAQMASAILSIPTGGSVDIVPWSTGTDAEIAAMVAALDAGTITISDTGWEIGDERTVSLSSMPATGVGESHAAQNVTMVLMDSQHYDLVGGGKDHFVVGLKDCLNEGGYMNPTATNTGSWDGCARRTWCNEVFRNSIPEVLRACFKQFECITVEESGGNTLKTSNDYFALFAEKELFGEKNKGTQVEANALSQIQYYSSNARRTKKVNGSSYVWWERTPYISNSFCMVNSNGTQNYNDANVSPGIAPFGCI